jgi:hypothetical protein
MTPTPGKIGARNSKEGCLLAVLMCNTGIDVRASTTVETIDLLVPRGFDIDYLRGLRAGFDGLSILPDREEEHNFGVFDGLQAASCLRQAGLLCEAPPPSKLKKEPNAA